MNKVHNLVGVNLETTDEEVVKYTVPETTLSLHVCEYLSCAQNNGLCAASTFLYRDICTHFIVEA